MGFNLNTVTISGNLTRDPELRTVGSNGTPVCSLSVAVNERTKDASGDWVDRPNFFDVTVWKGMGEWLAGNLHKGDGIAVQGRLRWRSWDKDGEKRSAVDIVAESVMPAQRSSGGGQSQQRSQSSASSDVPIDTGDFAPAAGSRSDDDIPF